MHWSIGLFRNCSTLLLFAFIGLACKKDESPGPDLLSFSPEKGIAGNFVTIKGLNFGTDSLDATVAIGGIPATISLFDDTSVTVVVPNGVQSGKIRLAVNGRVSESLRSFRVLPAKWIQKRSIQASSFEPRANGIAFAINGEGFYGLGYNGGTTLNDLWKYDPGTDSWSQKASCGLDFQSVVCMVINGKAYAGIGQSLSLPLNLTTQFWEYDPVADRWARKADFPGVPRWGAIGISQGNKGFVGGGDRGGGITLNDWWEYDPTADRWARKKDIPTSLQWPAGFEISGRIFLGTSAYGTSKSWFEYIPTNDSWITRSEFPGTIVFSPASMVIGSKGYVAGGGSECWAYDPATDAWTEQGFMRNILGGSAFSLNNRGYFLPGVGGGGSTQSTYWNKEVWELTPGQ